MIVRQGIPINPKLPRNFDSTPNDRRAPSHARWWNRPYIVIYNFDNPQFRLAWPNGRFDVRCLDGGAWDRSTWLGSFGTLEEAISSARRVSQ